MPTSVKMDEETKSRLEELQAEIRLETGTKITQQELLAELVDRTYETREAFVESFRETTVPLDDSAREAFHAGRISSGVETDEDDVDEVLYG